MNATAPGAASNKEFSRALGRALRRLRKEVMIAPGQESAVSFRIRYVRQIKKPAQDLNDQGEKLLFTRRSSMSLMNLVPVERKQSEAALLPQPADALPERFVVVSH